MRDFTAEDVERRAESLRISAVWGPPRAVLAMGFKRDDMSFQLVVQVRDGSPSELNKVDAFMADLEEERRECASIEFLVEHVEEAEVSADRGIDWFYVQWPHITYHDEPEDTETAPPDSGS